MSVTGTNTSHILHLLKLIFYAEYLSRTYIWHISILIVAPQDLLGKFFKVPSCGTCDHSVMF